MYKLEYLPVAQRDMVEIVRYISGELQNPAAANRLAMELVNAAESTTYISVCASGVSTNPPVEA